MPVTAMSMSSRTRRGFAFALDELARAGIAGIRVNLETVGEADPKAAERKLEAAAEQAKERRWHVVDNPARLCGF
jgi:hypothetical protein